ncbi:MAG: YlcI/YnfO family protein [Clostridia bacterium]
MNSFKIPIIPSTTQRSIRFPNDLIDDVEEAIRGKETTFTAFIVAATRHAIDELNNNNDNLS